MDVTGNEAKIICEDERKRPPASEVERLLCDNLKAKEILGWEPEYAGPEGLRRGLGEFIDWLKEPSNRSFYRNNNKYVI